MYNTVVRDFRLRTELLPDANRIRRGFGDVGGGVGVFVPLQIGPAMLVFLAPVMAVGVVVFLTEIERVDSQPVDYSDSPSASAKALFLPRPSPLAFIVGCRIPTW